jgi:hypothetical protein
VGGIGELINCILIASLLLALLLNTSRSFTLLRINCLVSTKLYISFVSFLNTSFLTKQLCKTDLKKVRGCKAYIAKNNFFFAISLTLYWNEIKTLNNLEENNPESGNLPTFNIFMSFNKCKLYLMKALAVLTLFPCLMVACIRVTPGKAH